MRERHRAHGLVAFVMVVALAGCGDRTGDTPPTISPAAAADSPPPIAAPAGSVRELPGPGRACWFDRATASLVVLTSSGGRDELAVLGASGPTRAIALDTPATALTGDGAGTVWAATRGGYERTGLGGGRESRVEVDGEHDTDFTAITRRGDGAVVLGSANGSVLTMTGDSGGAVAAKVSVFARVDELAALGSTVAVLDRAQTSVTTLNASGTAKAESLRAGNGATTMAADAAGRLLVADTRGGGLLVFTVDPLMLRQLYPVDGSPYGLAGSAGLAWVSETAANVVVGYDLSTGIPVEKVRHPTVRQPNCLALDDANDTLYVVSGSGAGVQVIRGAAR